MAKFAGYEVTVEIEKIKVHVKAEREIAGDQLAANVANKITGMFQPEALTEGTQQSQNGHPVIDAAIPAGRARKRSGGTRTAASANGNGAPVEWQHDVNKWSTPLQQWSQAQKINWLLYVLDQEGIRHGRTCSV